MLLVADANILFSFFDAKSKARKLLLLKDVELFSPRFLLKELVEHKEEIEEKFGLSEGQFSLELKLIETNVKLVPLKEFEDFVEKVKALSSDTDDLQYLALALKLNLPLWSNDKELKKQSVIKVFSTKELIEILGE